MTNNDEKIKVSGQLFIQISSHVTLVERAAIQYLALGAQHAHVKFDPTGTFVSQICSI